MFIKHARATVLGHVEGADPRKKTASSRTASYYLGEGMGKIDLEAALKDVSDLYAISDKPSDYIFVPARANSVDVPNENGDCFTLEESLRFDGHLARRVYQTYQLKPHHINHRADNPRMARGFVVDVHFNDRNPMPPEWRKKYEAATGNEHPKDIFVEALIAVDASKDPILADGYRRDVLRTFSMGCECDNTRCHVCGNIAFSKADFCNHIKGGNKRRFFPSKLFGGREVMAYEECNRVVYGELSGVDEPADPRAEKEGPAFSLQAAKKPDRRSLLAYLRENPHNIPQDIRSQLARLAVRGE